MKAAAEKTILYGNEKQKAYNFMYELNKPYPDQIAMMYFGARITYGKLFGTVERYAEALYESGVREGDVVTIVLPNVPEIVYLFYALNRIGAVASLIDPRTNAEAILERANEADSRLVFVIWDILQQKIDGISEKLHAEQIIVVKPSDSLGLGEIHSIEGLGVSLVYALKGFHDSKKYIWMKDFLKNTAPFQDSPFRPDCMVSILYTSGTSDAKAKGVVMSNEAYNGMPKQQMGGQKGFARQNTFLGAIPFFSAFGSLNGMHNSFCNGWTIIMIPKFHPNDFDLLLKKYKPNNSLGVPRFWESVADNGRLDRECLDYLILPTCGGDKISPASVEKVNCFFAEHGAKVKLIVGYGATEFGGAISVTTADEMMYEPGSAGIFMSDVIGLVIDPDTGKVQDGVEKVGELYVHTPTMMLGYYKDKAATDEITYFDENGRKYYRTGDKVRIDSRGINWVIDRYKRIILRPDGHTVGASPIENVIVSHPLVSGCAVVGIPVDEKSGVIPTAFLKLKTPVEDPIVDVIRAIDALCFQKLSERDKALAYVVVDELPYTLMGKVDYRKLEEIRFGRMQTFWVKDVLTVDKVLPSEDVNCFL